MYRDRVGTARQEAIIREAVGVETGIQVLGAIPRLAIEHLPSRHLGLVTPSEHPDVTETLGALGEAVARHVDVDALLDGARTGDDLGPARDTGAPRARKFRARHGRP